MHPDLRRRLASMRALGLRDFILVMRKYQIDTSTMNVE